MGSTVLKQPQAHIEQDIERMITTHYIRSDIKDFLAFYEQRIITHLITQIKSQYGSEHRGESIPPSVFWDIARMKAYDICIPICEEWIKSMGERRNELAQTITS